MLRLIIHPFPRPIPAPSVWCVESWNIDFRNDKLTVDAFHSGMNATHTTEFSFHMNRVEACIKAYSLNEWIDHKQDTKKTDWIEWLENAENKEIAELFKYLVK